MPVRELRGYRSTSKNKSSCAAQSESMLHMPWLRHDKGSCVLPRRGMYERMSFAAEAVFI